MRTQDTGRLAQSPIRVLMPIMAFVFMVYLNIGLAMPVLPLHIHQDLGFDTFVVGLVAGAPFAAALFSRLLAGRFTDQRGGRDAVVFGLSLAIASGGFYLLSMAFSKERMVCLGVLVLGRLLLGAAESFIITGALSWGMGLLGPSHSGRTIAWVGTAIYAAYGAGAPLGTLLYHGYTFTGIAGVTTLLPLVTLPLVLSLPKAEAVKGDHVPFVEVARQVWQPGVALSLSGVGFGAVTTFVSLLYVARGWGSAWFCLTAMSVAFMAGRGLLGHLPDRLGGARVAMVCILIQAFGLFLVWSAPWSGVALAGVILGGLGYSLVYPGLGAEVMRRTSQRARGTAMGTFTAFFDLSLGVSAPALGWMAGRTGLASVFMASGLLALGAAGMTFHLWRGQDPAIQHPEPALVP
ncbi:arabinose transporter [Geothrix limicola]|uniref:Arabinose transporter n=1 Tax=Geothrix limicola TaxID=2927978 RepID=A0ABQ5QFU9_9BACT|nr:arabinose transporter [Geothrix limicola]GLH73443.1 arabinose transporter [Geothrix limicola]